MVVAAARVLCKRGAEQCNVDADDSWKVYGEDYLADAAAALEAAGAPDLLAALVAVRNDAPLLHGGIGAMVDAAIAKATGAAS